MQPSKKIFAMSILRWRLRAYSIFLLAFAVFSLHAQTRSAISLEVDATQAPQRFIRAHMVIPVSPGPLTLYYPKWIPGKHDPSGPILDLVGLELSANGQRIPWRRDLLNMFAFHANVPDGVKALQVSLGYICGGSSSDKMVVINWDQNLLYPAGHLAQNLIYEATLRLPAGWKYGTALPVARQDGDMVEFKPVPLNRLVDSPVISGQYFRAVDVTPPGEPIHHEIDMAADSEGALDMSPRLQQDYTNLVAETGKLFGTRHYRDYHFLLSLSNHVAYFGLEHHESSDIRVGELSLLNPPQRELMAPLLPHEFVHSWNGKFRRPRDLSPPYYKAPQETDLLWVYEGLTQYLGELLAVRSGLWTPDQFRQSLALMAATLGPGRPGRTWRSLQDTADAAKILYSAPSEWINWRRGVDFYDEGVLLWLEVNTIIIKQTHGQKSLDDFCRMFYGGPNDGPQLKTYTFQDLVRALNQVAPYPWADFFHKRLASTTPGAPLGGIEASGWKVVYTDVEPPLLKAEEQVHNTINASYSIGLLLKHDGTIEDSIVMKPAYEAGIAPGMKLVAVNGRSFTPEDFQAALKASVNTSQPLQLLVLNDDYYKTYDIGYHGGERYPYLVRETGRPDLLSLILKPLSVR